MHDYIISALFLALSGVILWEANKFPPPPPHAMASSATFPRIVGILIIIFALLLIIRTVRKSKIDAKGDALNFRGILGISMTVVYLLILKPVGFIVSTTFILVSYSILLQKGRLKLIDTVIVPLLMVAIVYGMLYLLKVSIPTGLLF